MLIGRNCKTNLRIPDDDCVSGWHCRVRRGILEDLTSTHGTFVNASKLHGSVELREHDEVKVGRVRLVVRATGNLSEGVQKVLWRRDACVVHYRSGRRRGHSRRSSSDESRGHRRRRSRDKDSEKHRRRRRRKGGGGRRGGDDDGDDDDDDDDAGDADEELKRRCSGDERRGARSYRARSEKESQSPGAVAAERLSSPNARKRRRSSSGGSMAADGPQPLRNGGGGNYAHSLETMSLKAICNEALHLAELSETVCIERGSLVKQQLEAIEAEMHRRLAAKRRVDHHPDGNSRSSHAYA
uniref:FHA domain-containing protein n=2 Tax=Lotharella globosa TaxID=91324 RepID=A0A7S4DST1_9EUKA